MASSASTARRRGVGAEVRWLLRWVVVVASVLLVINVASRLYVLGQVAPKVDQLQQVDNDLAELNAAMIDEETGLRGFLATGATTFLGPYELALATVVATSDSLAAHVSTGTLARDLVLMQEARQHWVDNWASTAVRPETPARFATGEAEQRGELTDFLITGKALFDGYRARQEQFHSDLEKAQHAATADESEWLVWSGVVQGVIAFAVIVVAVLARRRLTRRITAPIETLAGAVETIAKGDLDTGVTEVDGPSELVALGRDIDAMAASLREQRALATERQEQALRHGERLTTVLSAAREVAGSLSMRYVMQAVANAALSIGSDRARIWLLDDDESTVSLAYDSAAGPEGPREPMQVPVTTGVVGRAARFGRPVGPEPCIDNAGVTTALPLIVGGRVVGALECHNDHDPETGEIQVLEALAGHAAAAVASARLHEEAVAHAVTDALTRLPNRRAFDAEYRSEVDRAMRYDRPLSLISVDLDHFKTLNDRYGHSYGDLALQQASDALRQTLRTTDRIFRIGGEEIAILCPETPIDEAAQLAERLRVAVENVAGPDAPPVTASFGVAEMPRHARDGARLVIAADRALYAAKRGGRNRVAIAVAVAAVPPIDGVIAQPQAPH